MFILTWIGIGIATGVLARRPIIRSGRAILLDVSLGVVGAVCSGWLIETSRGVEDSRPTPSSPRVLPHRGARPSSYQVKTLAYPRPTAIRLGTRRR